MSSQFFYMRFKLNLKSSQCISRIKQIYLVYKYKSDYSKMKIMLLQKIGQEIDILC